MWCVFMSVIVLVRDCNPLRTGAVGPHPDVVPCFLLRFLYTCFVLCGSRTGGMCQFSCGVNVIVTNFVTNFVGKWIMAYWRLILSA